MTQPLNVTQIRAWVAEAGQIALQHFGHADVQHKAADNSPVTVADRAIERLLTGYIRATYPDHGIVGEEYGSEHLDADYLWVIDPIDGTQAYIDGLPSWCITLAVLRDRVPVFGLVYLPLYNDWTYTDGDAVICNGQEVTHRLRASWAADSYVLWRSDAHRHYRLDFPRIMTMSSSASHTAYVARGSAVAALTHDSYLWDIAAGLAFMRQQGGDVRFLSGEALDLQHRDLLAPLNGLFAFGHPAVLDQLLPLVSEREEAVAVAAR